MWGSSEKFSPLIRRTWDNNTPGTKQFKLVRNLKSLKLGLKELNKDNFSDIEQSTFAMEKRVTQIQEAIGQDPQQTTLIEEEYQFLQELKELRTARDTFLAQKHKGLWLKGGDSNTAYFHGQIRHRHFGNKVYLIEDMKGKICDRPEDIQNAFLEFYQHLLGSTQSTKKVHYKIMDNGPKCTPDMADILMAPVTGKKIKECLFSIPDTKSPSPDGYTRKFFKDAWSYVGEDVIGAIKEFFSNKKLLKQLNATTLTLIPKNNRPTTVLQFRPIACCNLIYKVISKLLCSRMAAVLPGLIDHNQGAFVQGRTIQESILIY
ncbi:hypothetical protein vseg_000903 [Gypsophila vaccaria]